MTHYTRYHTDHLDPSVKAGHGLIIPCNICRHRVMERKLEYLYYMYSCCLEDLRTHYFLLHNDDDLLLKLYNTVRQHIVTENLAVDLKLCDSYFLSRCLICGHLFPSQLSLLRHEKICLSKIVSCSSFFGLRLVEDLFFSKYAKKASEEESNLHIVNQASLFLKRLRNDELTNPTSSKDPTITKTTTTDTENQPKPKPKPKPFEEYLSETYGQFVIRRRSKSVKQANPRDDQPSTNHLQTIYKPSTNPSTTNHANRAVLKRIDNHKTKPTSSLKNLPTQSDDGFQKLLLKTVRHGQKIPMFSPDKKKTHRMNSSQQPPAQRKKKDIL